jgi:hypothetical protein
MKVAIVASYKADKWTSHIAYMKSFADIGHDISIFSIVDDKGNLNFNSLDKLLDLRDTFDLVLTFGHGQVYDKRLFYKNFKCPVFGELGDDPQQFSNNIRCAELYDVILTPDLPSSLRYKDAGWENVYWWTHCFDQYIFKPYVDTPVENDVVTGMNEYGRRVKYLDVLSKSNFFNFVNKVTNENPIGYAMHLCSGDIVFNCSNYGEITRRIYEAMACGKFVLTDKISEKTGLYRHFADGIHFVTYSNPEDLIAKINYYLDNDEERENIAACGLSAVQEHSAMSRVQQLLEIYKEITKS